MTAQAARDARFDQLWDRAYRRLADACPDTPVVPGPPTGPGWLTALELAGNPEAFHQLASAERQLIHTTYGIEPRPYVPITWAIQHFSWAAAFSLTGPYISAGVVPNVDPADLALQWRPDGVIRLAIRPTGLTRRDGADPTALRAELRRRLTRLLEPMYGSEPVIGARPPAALWRTASDALANTLWYVGQQLGREEEAVKEAALMLGDTNGAVPPYIGGGNFRRLTLPDGHQRWTRERNACCFFYTIAPADTCLTCPRVSDPERIRRLHDQVNSAPSG